VVVTGVPRLSERNEGVPHITLGTENGSDAKLYYEDHGDGQPVVPDLAGRAVSASEAAVLE
jgi:hypothetical protein